MTLLLSVQLLRVIYLNLARQEKKKIGIIKSLMVMANIVHVTICVILERYGGLLDEILILKNPWGSWSLTILILEWVKKSWVLFNRKYIFIRSSFNRICSWVRFSIVRRGSYGWHWVGLCLIGPGGTRELHSTYRLNSILVKYSQDLKALHVYCLIEILV